MSFLIKVESSVWMLEETPSCQLGYNTRWQSYTGIVVVNERDDNPPTFLPPYCFSSLICDIVIYIMLLYTLVVEIPQICGTLFLEKILQWLEVTRIMVRS